MSSKTKLLAVKLTISLVGSVLIGALVKFEYGLSAKAGEYFTK